MLSERLLWELLRSLASSLASVAVLLAFVQAPSAHIHEHEATERHDGSFLHLHVPHIEVPDSDGPEWRDLDPDDDAQSLNWASLAPSYEGLVPVVLRECTVIVPVLAIANWQMTDLRPSAHDPPTSRATPPRAPPI